ncbi:AI-2E family transporter [Allorhodopirellula solitaria]|uniref:AI-2 transport protein TqsA n=1 Tax=Allorhodopirellula solitaria TaxID=2527987 RepID=A0A5C5XT53_9BACT|nr:AI-2E family transporter [Allorhodopirellula solitaria]TWT66436.1 AI-2 transport protein TqsA [Allorhodopirellula solitaria]
MTKPKSELALITTVAQLLAVVLAVAALFFARDVFIPLALGLLLSFLLSPIVIRLQRRGVPNVLAVVLTATLTFLLLAGVATLIGGEISNLISDLPTHRDELVNKARSMAGMTTGVGGSLDKLADDVTQAMESGAESETEDADEAESDDGASKSSEPAADSSTTEAVPAQATPPDDPTPGIIETPGFDDAIEGLPVEGLPVEALPDRGPTNVPGDRSLVQRWTDRFFPAPGADQMEFTHDGSSPKRPLYMIEIQDDLPLASWASTAGTMLGPLATAGLVCVIALFTLIHREDLRDRIIAVVSHGDYVTTTEAMDEAAGRISRYLIAQTIVNTSYGVVLSIGLAVIGALMTEQGAFPNVLLWGAMGTCLRFVPYIGPIASAVFPLTMAFAVFPGYSVFIAVAALIVTMELISNNVLEPWLYGASTGISAVAVVFAAIFWGWLWGPVGLFLSTPLTVCFVVLGRYAPRFEMLSILLGEDVQISPSMRFYQRLLASDEHRAGEILTQHVEEHGIDQTCDNVLVPALKRIRLDHDAENLTDADANRLFALTGGLIAAYENPEPADPEDLQDGKSQLNSGDETEASPSEASSAGDSTLPTIVGCTSHHFSEILILNLLRIAGAESFRLTAIDDEKIPQDVGKQVAQMDPPLVVIVVLPKGGFAQARYLCKTIRGEGYQGAVVIACLGKFKNYDNLFVKFRKAGATSMTTSYSQTAAKIRSILAQNDPVLATDKAAMKNQEPS